MRIRVALLVVGLAACSTGSEPIEPSTSAPVTTSAPPTTPGPVPGDSSTVAGPTTTATAEATTTTTTLPRLETIAYRLVADGLPFPTDLAARPESAMAVLATKDGRVWPVADGTVGADPLLDIADRVRNQGEQGLLGIAIHPAEPLVYLHYSANDGDTVLSEFRGDETGIDPASERVLLRLDQPAANHNGGPVRFGPDSMLYLALGDGGGAGDRFGNGQDTSTPLGGILRIDPTGARPYAIPADNPFASGGGVAELWAYGLRNPWKIDFDGEWLYVADVGQNRHEEVSVVRASTPGLDFGWPVTEGTECYGSADCDTSGIVMPAVTVDHGDDGTCSISGGAVYRGTAIPELAGHYFYSDFCGGWLRSFRWDGARAVDRRDWTDAVGASSGVVGVVEDGRGELYVLSSDRVVQIVPVRG